MTKYYTTVLLCFLSACVSFAQDGTKKEKTYVYQTFKDTRVINTHSVETLKAGQLDFRVGHRFGDILGDDGGWETFYGLESASDVVIGLEYGFSNNFMMGISRSKGSDRLRQNVNAMAKAKLATQQKNGLPFSATLMGLVTGSTMGKSKSESDLNFFAKPEHRFSYHGELLLAKKFSNYFSLQLSTAWTYRNIVPNGDENDIVSASLSSRIQVTKPLAIILDGRYLFSEYHNSKDENGDRKFYPQIGIGLEWETGGGHIFQMNLTNAKGMIETDYIPYTDSNWLDGGFRLGFTIARLFRL